MPTSTEQIKELREKTGAGIMECKRALDEGGSMSEAEKLLKQWGLATAEKKAGREAGQGVIECYVHASRIGAMVELNCETDFVARTDDFKELGKHLAEHVAAAAPIAVDKDEVPKEKIEAERRIYEQQVRESGKPENMIAKIVDGKVEAYYKDVCLLYQPWVREPKKTIGELVKEVAAKTGENIKVRRFVRYQLGEM